MIDYESLRVAILHQAVKDYQTALKAKNDAQCLALERWFRSDWGQWLSGDTGDLIIADCQKRAAAHDRPNRLANKVERKKKYET
jgi:hypothetical protein